MILYGFRCLLARFVNNADECVLKKNDSEAMCQQNKGFKEVKFLFLSGYIYFVYELDLPGPWLL